MSKLTAREKTLIYLALLIFVWVFSFRFLFQPLMDSYSQGKQNLTQAKARLNELETYKLKLESGQTKHKDYEQKLKEVDLNITNTNESAEILDQVKQVAEANSLKLTKAEIADNPSDEQKSKEEEADSFNIPGLKQLEVKATVKGEYKPITAFTKAVYEEQKKRNLLVKRIEFNYDDKGLEADLDIAAYVLDQKRPYEDNKVSSADGYNPDKPFGRL